MAEQHRPATIMRVVTLSREYGSGGGEIAARLARRLAWRLIDHEIVARVAQELGITAAEAATYDEQGAGRVARFLRSLTPLDAGGIVRDREPLEAGAVLGGGALGVAPTGHGVDERTYHAMLRQVVEAVADAGQVVIVGRGAQAMLAGRRDALHARVVAPLEERIAYVARREGLGEAAARARIERKDRARARYLQAHYQRVPDDPHLYDLVLNTGVLALDSAVELLALALEHKGRQLAAPAEEAGPAAGLAPYPGPPGEFGPPARPAEPSADD